MLALPSRRPPFGTVVLPAVLVLATAPQVAAGICVNVELRFWDAPSPVLVASLQRETEMLWEPYELRIHWAGRTAASCVDAQGTFRVLVDRSARSAGATPAATLGRTTVPVGRIGTLPVYIDQEATEEALEALSAGDLMLLVGHPFEAPADVGRALGRVLAHEIGHVILGAPGHQPRGLMRFAFPPAELIGHSRQAYRLSSLEQVRLRQREAELQTQRGH